MINEPKKVADSATFFFLEISHLIQSSVYLRSRTYPTKDANATEMQATIPVVVASCKTNSIIIINTLKNSDILKNGNLNPSVHGSSEAFQFLVIRLWMMRRAAHTTDAQRTNTRFSGEPNLVYKNPLATPQPIIPIQIKKTFIILFFVNRSNYIQINIIFQYQILSIIKFFSWILNTKH